MSKSSQRQSEALYIALISEERFYPSPKQDLLFRVLEFRVRSSLGFNWICNDITHITHEEEEEEEEEEQEQRRKHKSLSREEERTSNTMIVWQCSFLQR